MARTGVRRNPILAQERLARARDGAGGASSASFRARADLEESGQRAKLVAQAVASAKAGDRDAFHYLYVRYADHVYGYVRSIVRDEHEAEDVTQQVFAKLLVNLGKYEPRDATFAAWILRVARNLAVDHLRQRKLVLCDDVREARPEPEDLAPERCRSVHDALASLPVDQRTVLVLRHVVGLSPPEIAALLDRSEGSVHGLHHRGRGALRKALLERGTAPATARRAAGIPDRVS